MNVNLDFSVENGKETLSSITSREAFPRADFNFVTLFFCYESFLRLIRLEQILRSKNK